MVAAEINKVRQSIGDRLSFKSIKTSKFTLLAYCPEVPTMAVANAIGHEKEKRIMEFLERPGTEFGMRYALLYYKASTLGIGLTSKMIYDEGRREHVKTALEMEKLLPETPKAVPLAVIAMGYHR